MSIHRYVDAIFFKLSIHRYIDTIIFKQFSLILILLMERKPGAPCGTGLGTSDDITAKYPR